jgi:capsular polysaccharide biosynthesis protein
VILSTNKGDQINFNREVYREVIKTQQAIEELKAELKEETVPWNVLRMYNVVKYER